LLFCFISAWLVEAVAIACQFGIFFKLCNSVSDLLLRKDSNTVLHYAVRCDHQKGRMGEKLSRKLIEKGAGSVMYVRL